MLEAKKTQSRCRNTTVIWQ